MLFEAIEVALISAYKRNFNSSPNVRVDIDRQNGEIKVFRSWWLLMWWKIPGRR